MKNETCLNDHMADLGELAMVSRLRRFSDAMWAETSTLYQNLGFDFQPRWFAVFSALGRHQRSSISELAGMVGLTTQGVGKIVNDLQAAGLISEVQNINDSRERRIVLSPHGRLTHAQLEPVWRGIRSVAEALMAEAGVDLVKDLEKLETALARQSLGQRFHKHFKLAARPDFEIVDYRPAYKKHFRALNEQWLSTHFRIEEHDALLLADPNARIIKRGGFILFAVSSGKVVGTCAVVRHPSGELELAKMVVAPANRNRGIGSALVVAAVERALKSGAPTLYLRTHPDLTAAKRVYRKIGFRPITKSPLPSSGVHRDAIIMRLHEAAYRKFQ